MRKILAAMTLSVLSTAFTARAAEGGSGHYAPGSYLDFSAMPASQPGFYVANYFLVYDDGTVNASTILPRGGIFAAGLTVNVQSDAPGVVYAYPFRLDNITFSTGVYPSWIWEQAKVTASFNGNFVHVSGAREQSVNGFGDIQITPIQAGWTNGDFTVGGMFNVWAPTGDFNARALVSPGAGYWTFEPMLAFSWLSSRIGTEFTVFPAVDFNTINNTTDYKSGDIFHVDATLAQHLPLFGGFVGAGASVSYIKQISGDSGSGARLGSFEEESLSVGPTVSYILPIGKNILIADASWLPQVQTQNTTKGSYIWVKLAIAF